jgi:hypothetical protein
MIGAAPDNYLRRPVPQPVLDDVGAYARLSGSVIDKNGRTILFFRLGAAGHPRIKTGWTDEIFRAVFEFLSALAAG